MGSAYGHRSAQIHSLQPERDTSPQPCPMAGCERRNPSPRLGGGGVRERSKDCTNYTPIFNIRKRNIKLLCSFIINNNYLKLLSNFCFNLMCLNLMNVL